MAGTVGASPQCSHPEFLMPPLIRPGPLDPQPPWHHSSDGPSHSVPTFHLTCCGRDRCLVLPWCSALVWPHPPESGQHLGPASSCGTCMMRSPYTLRLHLARQLAPEAPLTGQMKYASPEGQPWDQVEPRAESRPQSVRNQGLVSSDPRKWPCRQTMGPHRCPSTEEPQYSEQRPPPKPCGTRDHRGCKIINVGHFKLLNL